MSKIVIKGRSITSGVAEGEAMVTREAFGFSHGIDPNTGRVSDEGHEWAGQNVKTRVMVFPFGKGSTSGGLYILEAAKLGNAPAAVINVETEPVIAAGFIMADILFGKQIPVVDRLERDPIELIKTGDRVRVDASKGIVEIYH